MLDAILLFAFLFTCFYLYDRVTRKPPRISESEALVLAQRFAEEHHLQIESPYVVQWDRSWWLVYLTGGRRPSVWVAVDSNSGEILGTGSLIR